ncbi:MAG: ABC-2 family transporter protein [Opitutaceae bacterium]
MTTLRLFFDKYRHVFGMGVQGALVYRWNFLIRAGFSIVQLLVVIILWLAAFRGQETIGGFPLDQTITYFLIALFANYLIAAFNEDFQISEEIRNGLINQFITKPIDYFVYRLTLFFAGRVVTGFLVLVPFALILPFTHQLLVFPGEPWRWAAAVPAFVMAALIQFTIAFCFGMLAFWFLDIAGWVILSMAVESLLSGQIFPLDLLPESLYRISVYLPFTYQIYFPVALVSGRLDQGQVINGLFIQAFWTIAFILLARVLWNVGLRKHTAVGG